MTTIEYLPWVPVASQLRGTVHLGQHAVLPSGGDSGGGEGVLKAPCLCPLTCGRRCPLSPNSCPPRAQTLLVSEKGRSALQPDASENLQMVF